MGTPEKAKADRWSQEIYPLFYTFLEHLEPSRRYSKYLIDIEAFNSHNHLMQYKLLINFGDDEKEANELICLTSLRI